MKHAFILLMGLMAHTALGRPSITMGTFSSPQDSPVSRICELIYKDAFSRLGYDFSYRVVPAQRASVDANSGVLDGEPARRIDHNLKYPNLVRVDEPIYTVVFAAFSANKRLNFHGWESLKSDTLRVDYLRGIPVIQENLANFIKPNNLYLLNDRAQASRRLLSGRADVYIDSELDFAALLQLKQNQNLAIYNVGIVDRIPTYGFLHKKHQDLVVRLVEVLRQMKKDGRLQRYEHEISSLYLKPNTGGDN